MSVTLRKPTPADGEPMGKLIFDAFASIHDCHNFLRDFLNLQAATGFAQMWISHPGVWGILAQREGRIIGCNFLDQRNSVPGVGPICIDPHEQGGGIGRKLMQAVIDRGRESGARSMRLMQDAFNTASMSLYASLGFAVNEPAVVMTGKVAASPDSAASIRPMRPDDLPACGELCRRVHGFDRNGELQDAMKMFKPFVAERGGAITAYLSSPPVWHLNHGVAATGQDMQDLLAGTSAQTAEPIALLIPTRNSAFFRWCLAQRLRAVKPMSLMTLGDYREPQGWWFPSVLY